MTHMTVPPEVPDNGSTEQDDRSGHLSWGYLNSATIRGAVSLVLGLNLLLLPNLSIALLEFLVGLAAVASGLFDLWFAVTGRRYARAPDSRLVALVRGLVSLAFAAYLALTPSDALDLLVELVGLYLVIRGAVSVLSVLLRRRGDRGPRLASGLSAAAFGIICVAAPETVAEGVIVVGSVVAVVIGGILLTYGLRRAHQGAESADTSASVTEILWDWIKDADIGDGRRDQLADGLYFDEPDRLNKISSWTIQLVLSVAIATFAVVADSTAVVIGAMLIAPLMVPILALAGALVNGWSRRASQSAIMLTFGVLLSIALAYALSAWVPAVINYDTNTQIVSRVNPSMTDLLIALAAGAAGAFATVNSRVASSLPGVAIAVALVPPLAVVGVSLGGGRWQDAGGALLLFLTNFVAIVLAASAVFVLGGFAQHLQLRASRKSILKTFAPFGAMAAIILVPLVFASQGLLATSTAQSNAQGVVGEWLGEDTLLKVEEVSVSGETVTVKLSGPSQAPPIDTLQSALIEELGRPVGVVVEVEPVAVQQRPPPG